MQGGAPQILGGPVWWAVFGVYALSLALAAYVSIDSWRLVRAERLAALREPSWVYRVLQPAFLLLAIIVWIPAVPRVLAALPVGLCILALVGQFAYLLRVVFPKPGAASDVVDAEPDALAEELLADGGDTVEPESHPTPHE